MSRMLQISSKERKSQRITWEYSLHIRGQAEVGGIQPDTRWINKKVREGHQILQERCSRDTQIHHYIFSISSRSESNVKECYGLW